MPAPGVLKKSGHSSLRFPTPFRFTLVPVCEGLPGKRNAPLNSGLALPQFLHVGKYPLTINAQISWYGGMCHIMGWWSPL